MNRVDGFLDLDEYYDSLSLEEQEKRICETGYSDMHFRLTLPDGIYYYKQTVYPYREVIAYYIAKQLGFKAIKYDLAQLHGTQGVISPDFNPQKFKFVHGYEVLDELYSDNQKLVEQMGLPEDALCNYGFPGFGMNTLELIWQALELRYKDNPNVSIKALMDEIINHYIFALLLGDPDKGAQNWDVVEENDNVYINAIYDNEGILPDYEDYTVSMGTSFKDLNQSVAASVKEFLDISSQEYIDNFIEKFQSFNLSVLLSAIESAERQIKRKIPIYEKNELIKSYEYNHRLIDETLKNQGILSRKGI